MSDGWLTDAVSALREISQRAGHVTSDHLDGVLPPGSGDPERVELLSALAVYGVYVVGLDVDLQSPTVLSIAGIYNRDMRLRPLLGRRGEQILSTRLRQGERWMRAALSRTVAAGVAAGAIVRSALDRQRSFDDVFFAGRELGGRAGLQGLLSALEDSVASVIQVERLLWPRWRRRGVDYVAGRHRLRMARAIDAFRFTGAVYDELFGAVLDAYRKVLAVHERRHFAATHRSVFVLGGSPRDVVLRKRNPPRALDTGAFLRATIRRARAGREQILWARAKFVEANLRLPHMFAGRMYRPGLGLAFPDLVQEGNIGLIRAVEKYDSRRGTRFSTYAAWWIKQAMTRAIAETGRLVRIPSHVQELAHEVSQVEAELMVPGNGRPTVRQLADVIDVEPRMIDRVRAAPRHPVWLDDPVSAGGEEEDAPTWASRLVDSSVPDPEQAVEATERRRHLYAVMRLELPAVEQAALCYRFGLPRLAPADGVRELEQLPRQRVRRLEIQALAKLQQSEHRQSLEPFRRGAEASAPDLPV